MVPHKHRPFFRSTQAILLEVESPCELNKAPSRRGCGVTKLCAVDVIVWLTKIHTLKDVEEVSPKREPVVLAQRDALDERKVHFVEARSVELIAAYCSLSTGALDCRPCVYRTSSSARVWRSNRAGIPEQACARSSLRSWVRRLRCGAGQSRACRRIV